MTTSNNTAAKCACTQVYAPLLRDGRMEKFYWKPENDELANILHHMFRVSIEDRVCMCTWEELET